MERETIEEHRRDVRDAILNMTANWWPSMAALSTYDLVAPLERPLSRPVLTTSQVGVWAAFAPPSASRSSTPGRVLTPANILTSSDREAGRFRRGRQACSGRVSDLEDVADVAGAV